MALQADSTLLAPLEAPFSHELVSDDDLQGVASLSECVTQVVNLIC